MKLILRLNAVLLVLSLSMGNSVSAQKQLKTFNEKKFAKKVILNLDPTLIHKLLPDEEDIAYMCETLDIPEEEALREIELAKERAGADAKWLNDHKVWRKLEGVELSNEEMENGIRFADIVLNCSYKGKTFKLVLRDCYQTKRSWYIGRAVIPEGEEIQDIVDEFWKWRNGGEELSEEMEVAETVEVDYSDEGEAEEETDDSAYAEAEEGVANADALIDLPNEFSELPDVWTFKAIYDGDKDMTSQYENGFIDGNPITMDLRADGNLYYQRGYCERNHIGRSQWNYIQVEDRDEREKEIDFEITNYLDNVEGANESTEKYSLVSVTENELIYENKRLNMRWVWIKK